MSRSPSPKRLKTVDPNDSFYDSEDDEFLSQACAADEPSNVSYSKESFSTTRGTPLHHSTPDVRRPAEQSRTPGATTLKGKPLSYTPANKPDHDPCAELVMSSTKPFYRLANERKELQEVNKSLGEENTSLKEERDDLRGQVIYLEQSVKTKDKDMHELRVQAADWRKKFEEAERQSMDDQSKHAELVGQLQTQIRFLEEERRAGAFEHKEHRDENKEDDINAVMSDQEAKLLTPVRGVQTIKPRMTNASATKLNFS